MIFLNKKYMSYYCEMFYKIAKPIIDFEKFILKPKIKK